MKYQDNDIFRFITICLTIFFFGSMCTSIAQAHCSTYRMMGSTGVLDNVPYLVASVTTNEPQGTAPYTVQFIDNGTGEPTSYQWTFRDVNFDAGVPNTFNYTSTEQSPIVTFPGSEQDMYWCYLTTYEDILDPRTGKYTRLESEEVFYLQFTSPFASFTANPKTGAAPLTVSFTDTSTESYNWYGVDYTTKLDPNSSWYWDFGDGNTSTDQNPTHTYYTAGNYVVNLTVADHDGTDTTSQTITVNQPENPPVASFTANPTTGDIPLSVIFTDTSQSDITKWNWDFGDGNTSTDQNPTNIYSKPGTYQVSLTVTNATGTDTTSQTITVNQPENPPIASFDANPMTGNAPLDVNFVDTSTGSPTSWTWDFGDLTSAEHDQNTKHTFTEPGNYTVSLQVSNNLGMSRVERVITVLPPVPVASFTVSPVTGVAPLTVTCRDTSTGMPTSWSWNFGDKTPAFTYRDVVHSSITHSYAKAGKYTVTLTVSNSAGSNTAKFSNVVVTKTAPPITKFSATPTTGYAPLTVKFTDQSYPFITDRYWNFGDGSTSKQANPSHIYDKAGNYTVTLTVANPAGEAISKPKYIIVKLLKPPVVNFSATPTSGKAPLSVKFTDKSTNNPTSWSWNFGDGDTSKAQSPSHKYTKKGTYSVSLTVKNTAGSDSITKSNYITVK